jgi:hypothetical protein
MRVVARATQVPVMRASEVPKLKPTVYIGAVPELAARCQTVGDRHAAGKPALKVGRDQSCRLPRPTRAADAA